VATASWFPPARLRGGPGMPPRTCCCLGFPLTPPVAQGLCCLQVSLFSLPLFPEHLPGTREPKASHAPALSLARVGAVWYRCRGLGIITGLEFKSSSTS
jgi:hypothetical protein